MTPTQPTATTTEVSEAMVKQVMREEWDEICSDTGCHPLDITHQGRKLFFHPSHWAAAIAKRLAHPTVVTWQDIASAPRDGTHILARASKAPYQPPTTVHWFDDGWHLSVNALGDYSDHGCSALDEWISIPSEAALSTAPSGDGVPGILSRHIVHGDDAYQAAIRAYLASHEAVAPSEEPHSDFAVARDAVWRSLETVRQAALASPAVAPVAQSEPADLIERLRGPVFGTQTALDAATAIETWKARAERLADMHRDMCVVAGKTVARAETAEAALASRAAILPVEKSGEKKDR